MVLFMTTKNSISYPVVNLASGMLTAADTVNRLSDIQRTLSNIENTLTNMKKPKKKAIPVPRSEEPSLDLLMHNLTDVTIGTTLNIKLFIGGPIDLYLHSTSMYESPVNSPLVILFRPQQKTIVFNSLVADQFDIEEKRNIPMTIPNIIQLDIQLQETDIEEQVNCYAWKLFRLLKKDRTTKLTIQSKTPSTRIWWKEVMKSTILMGMSILKKIRTRRRLTKTYDHYSNSRILNSVYLRTFNNLIKYLIKILFTSHRTILV
ncbi:Protein CBG27870 [Caenorhabditis briggsae]|uniref:Protein CBG27870 n=1 Tax=Caenorhabditis briggsae TaxID=6238 RepID=B6IEG5_CAEBR|nr:Protein CBG27870 [Caenorhabditis briggsae]CAR98295.1 Protein CBG27870 [Caenorhabditis briggsae]